MWSHQSIFVARYRVTRVWPCSQPVQSSESAFPRWSWLCSTTWYLLPETQICHVCASTLVLISGLGRGLSSCFEILELSSLTTLLCLEPLSPIHLDLASGSHFSKMIRKSFSEIEPQPTQTQYGSFFLESIGSWWKSLRTAYLIKSYQVAGRYRLDCPIFPGQSSYCLLFQL